MSKGYLETLGWIGALALLVIIIILMTLSAGFQ